VLIHNPTTSESILEWSMARNAKLRKLTITASVQHDTWVRYLLEQGNRVRHIQYDVYFWDEELDGLLIRVAQCCVVLEKFHLRASYIEHEQVAVLLGACRNLTNVSLRPLSMANLAVLTRLRDLKVSIDSESKSAKKLSKECNLPNLQRLDLICYCTHPHFPSAVYTIATSCQWLMNVGVNPLNVESAMAFVTHCPGMRHFEATLDDAITPPLLDAIAANWKNLHHLLLWRKADFSVWSDEHDTAVVNLIQRVTSLTHLMCFNGTEAIFLNVRS
jgi:hypothetical protein